MTAIARIVEVAPEPNDRLQESHFEIEWVGRAGKARSGRRYHSIATAEAMAAECGGESVEIVISDRRSA